MLHELLSSNRRELIGRCKAKAARRFAPSEVPPEADHGVPLFLDQLVDTLRLEQSTAIRTESEPQPTPAPTEIGRSAALHGSEMLQRGYTVDQVVHGYGDVCQSITELAVEQGAPVSADEFRTLNRCLDNAIADAVTSYAEGGQSSINAHAENLGERLNAFAIDHEHLLELAMKSYAAIQTGTIGPSGATGIAHRNLLLALRSLTRQFMNQARTASAQSTQPPYPRAPSAK
jgi:hypothetical protein